MRRYSRSLHLLGVALVTLPAVAMAEVPVAVRDHHLFVGADVMVRSDGAFIPVRNVRGKSVLLDGPEPTYLPIRKTEGMSIQLSPKVSAVAAHIEAFETAAIFVPTMGHIVDQAQMELFIQNQTAMAEANQFQAESEMIQNDPDGVGNAFSVVGSGGGGDVEGQLGAATDALENLANLEEASDWEEGLVTGADQGQGNAVKVSFLLSSEIEIADGYVVAMVRVRAEERLMDLTLFDHVGRVTPKGRRVTMVQRDLPAGLEIKEAEVYLFSRGEEIPTNLSPKHLKITRAEAQEFARISHVGEHRTGEAPARPVWALAPPGLLGASDTSRIHCPVQIELDADGTVLTVQGEGDVAIPTDVKKLIEEMTFLPALRNGAPVASVLTVNPADFFTAGR